MRYYAMGFVKGERGAGELKESDLMLGDFIEKCHQFEDDLCKKYGVPQKVLFLHLFCRIFWGGSAAYLVRSLRPEKLSEFKKDPADQNTHKLITRQ